MDETNKADLENIEDTREDMRPEVSISKRKVTKRQKRLLFVSLVIIMALIIGLWGTTSLDYLTVSDVVIHPELYTNKTIAVMGTVDDWNSSAKSFNLSDNTNKIAVSYIILPEGFNNGKDIVVMGVLEENNGFDIKAKEIIVGCPSRY